MLTSNQKLKKQPQPHTDLNVNINYPNHKEELLGIAIKAKSISGSKSPRAISHQNQTQQSRFNFFKNQTTEIQFQQEITDPIRKRLKLYHERSEIETKRGQCGETESTVVAG